MGFDVMVIRRNGIRCNGSTRSLFDGMCETCDNLKITTDERYKKGDGYSHHFSEILLLE